MFKQFMSLIQYLGWLDSKRLEAKAQDVIFRISEIRKNLHGETILLIQIVNKAFTFMCKPAVLVESEYLIEGFTKQDIRAITFLATKEMYQPKYFIASHYFSDKLKKYIFKLRKHHTNSYQLKTTAQISRDKKLLHALRQEDALRIGYMIALEESILEKEILAQNQHH